MFLLIYILALCSILVTMASATVIGRASIKAPAVIVFNNTGSITTISLNLTTGNGTVTFVGPSAVANSTLDSAITAARYASTYLGKNFSSYNFIYTINDGGANVSGPSAGAALTLLAISAFNHVPIRNDITITGTISPNGSIGQIGGVIDKVSAASAAGLALAVVPSAESGSLEQGLYLIAQDEYHIPVVQASNISQALFYVTNPSFTGSNNSTAINFSVVYNLTNLPTQQISCLNNCITSPFSDLANVTITNTKSQIANLSSNPSFDATAAQLAMIDNESSAIISRNYLYVGADVAFLDYLNAFYLSSYKLQRDAALGSMDSIQILCQNLTPPQLTMANYEYIIAAQMRQGWGNFTINSTIGNFNATGATTDDIVSGMYTAGQAKAWCNAAYFLYNYSYLASQAVAIPNSSALKSQALSRLNKASSYPSMYLTLAQESYKQSNYPVAIFDADYAYVLSNSTSRFSEPISTLDNISISMAQNSTYGAWATEFAKESMFYVYQSHSTANTSRAQYYAQEAYTSASLANALSIDTALISQNLVSIQNSSTTIGQQSTTGQGQSSSQEGSGMIMEMISIVIALQVVVIALIIVLLLRMPSRQNQRIGHGQRRRGR